MSTPNDPAFFPDDPRVGSILGGTYHVVGVLGEGAIGRVYRAEYGAGRVPVALKILHREHAENPETAARFEREIGAMAGLSHPNIIRAFDTGRTPTGESFVVMELAEGETLRTLLHRAGALPLPTVLVIARGVTAALERAHAVGVVHRDLKPENIMVANADGPELTVKVLDFGMARVVSGALSSRGLTVAGTVMGSPSYMSPEQAQAVPAGDAADQYALGIVLYEMLAGHCPFPRTDMLTMLRNHVHTPPPPLTDAAPSVPMGVADAVVRMLAKRPEERFPNVSAALAALEAGARVSVVAVPETAVARANNARAITPARAVAMAGIAALALALVLWLALR